MERERTQRRDRRRIGTPTQRDNESAGTTLAQIVEQAQTDGPSEFLLFQRLGCFPGLGLNDRRFWRARRKLEIDADHLSGIAGLGLVTAGSGAVDSHGVDIHDGRRHVKVAERESWTTGEQLPAAGDHRISVIDRAAGFVAQQIGIDIDDVKHLLESFDKKNNTQNTGIKIEEVNTDDESEESEEEINLETFKEIDNYSIGTLRNIAEQCDLSNEQNNNYNKEELYDVIKKHLETLERNKKSTNII